MFFRLGGTGLIGPAGADPSQGPAVRLPRGSVLTKVTPAKALSCAGLSDFTALTAALRLSRLLKWHFKNSHLWSSCYSFLVLLKLHLLEEPALAVTAGFKRQKQSFIAT